MWHRLLQLTLGPSVARAPTINPRPASHFLRSSPSLSPHPATVVRCVTNGSHSLENRSATVYLAYRRRERGEFGPAISDITVVYTGKVPAQLCATDVQSSCTDGPPSTFFPYWGRALTVRVCLVCAWCVCPVNVCMHACVCVCHWPRSPVVFIAMLISPCQAMLAFPSFLSGSSLFQRPVLFNSMHFS